MKLRDTLLLTTPPECMEKEAKDMKDRFPSRDTIENTLREVLEIQGLENDDVNGIIADYAVVRWSKKGIVGQLKERVEAFQNFRQHFADRKYTSEQIARYTECYVDPLFDHKCSEVCCQREFIFGIHSETESEFDKFLRWYFYEVLQELDAFGLVPHINSITCMNYNAYRALLSNIELTQDFPQIKIIQVRTLLDIYMCPSGFFLCAGGRGFHPRLRVVQRIEPGEQEDTDNSLDDCQEVAGKPEAVLKRMLSPEESHFKI